MAFTYTLSSLISDLSSVSDWFVDQFVDIADMFFNSPFVFFVALSIILVILGVVAAFLRVRMHG